MKAVSVFVISIWYWMLSDLFSTILLQWWMAVLYMVKVYVKVIPLAESRDFRTRISLRQMSLLIIIF